MLRVHAIMGPNGSGKSTLAAVLAGRDGFDVTAGSATFKGQDLFDLEPEERAREGLFLAFQYPVEIPGVNNAYLLKAALNEVRKHRGEPVLDAIDFMALARERMKLLAMDDSLMNRPVNEGFSGGEKKRNEIFQMADEPARAVTDERRGERRAQSRTTDAEPPKVAQEPRQDFGRTPDRGAGDHYFQEWQRRVGRARHQNGRLRLR